MAFGDVIISASGTNSTGESSVTFGATATSGNLLIYAVSYSLTVGVGGAWNSPTGFTGPIQEIPVDTGNLGCAWWYKISDGTETSASTNISLEAGNWTAAVIEFEGPFEASPLDVSAEDESNIAAVDTSQSSGTTATTAQADALAVAFFGADNGSNVTDGRGYTNDFNEIKFVVSGARASTTILSKVLSATGTVETTFSTSDTGDEMYGSVAVFKKQAAAGGGTLPPGKLQAMGIIF